MQTVTTTGESLPGSVFDKFKEITEPRIVKDLDKQNLLYSLVHIFGLNLN